ncbi:MAG: hypothetical protein Q4D52_02670 [Eubacteriales bacterium]|nr:hypothetical protein [Eubacteriales bacterium]
MKQILFIIYGFLICSVLAACSTNAKTAPNIETIQATYGVNLDSYPHLVGAADYVIIGEVKEELEAIQKKTSGPSSIPYSCYMVQVAENLKGQLDMSKPIQINKHGGKRGIGNTYHLLGNDLLPEVGKSYIFVLNEQEDGSLLASGTNSTIPLEDSDTAISTRSSNAIEKSGATKEEIVATFRNACENQILPSD